MPSSHPESTGSDDNDLPSLAKFLHHPPAQSKLASRLSEIADSEGDSEELEIASRTSLSGPLTVLFCLFPLCFIVSVAFTRGQHAHPTGGHHAGHCHISGYCVLSFDTVVSA